MKTNIENQSDSLDIVKWGVAALLVATAVIGNQFYADANVVARVAGVIIAFAIAGVIALQTSKGKQAQSFAREAHIEVRKVVWPTRQEALNTTFIVLAATAVMALILWGLDAILLRVVNLITGV
ncbi:MULTISPECIES: preprotein translocase subunit SecE [Shewanella]|jgi:preprotein translocase subunit SecE|uniref:Protein translocase subunit SecE n=1 Tax=Shewanella psychromarinicola TaxID=2487742 RepID=A0A3N4E095_9GAMM|nr:MULTISPECIES: preprotein translocase subunit SecE [Shewanella]AZG34472.1 preprotein translocase subunit SecE [Shewanella psychromarinicola]MCL1083322.1 preprotein translocase subunit SecE [Shewanella psychromarinicola]PKG79472.1 preprotein translocase subunit SecE [Shewanella sp. Actino-trap-3]RPA23114.1 preprotein translocase subunit SecE [Shewanella psychromarinicola]|tara:strand:+ start:258 stop:629 length:372 start_codon:yes stop_codon:yes gene_type:complete